MYRLYLKTIFDFVGALTALVILSPLLFIIAIAVKIETKGPYLFKQPRLGKDGRVFKILKFRSMVYDQSKYKTCIEVYEDDPRITKIGKFIRKTSLDELPQLINILRGEMSFIGPRPPLTYFPKKYEDYHEFERKRFSVKPGISGLAQIRCREIHDWDINIPIDIEYVNSYSFLLDLKLFMLSILAFFKTSNVFRRR